MPHKSAELMTRIKYAETLIGEALTFNRCSRKAEKVRAALLLSALRELEAETTKTTEVS